MTKRLFRSATFATASLVLLAAGGAALATPAEARQAGQRLQTDETRTTRSDGAVAPQVRQSPRREQRRQSRITTTSQALPAHDSWQSTIDPPDGGLTVAPAGTAAGDMQAYGVNTGSGLPLVGVVDIPLRPAPSGTSTGTAQPSAAARSGGER